MKQEIFGCLLLLILASCATDDEADQRTAPPPTEGTTAAEADTLAAGVEGGNLVYVPVYSHIFYRNQQRVFNLTVTLSLRNASPTKPIGVHRVDYFDSDGNLVRSYIDAPQRIPPLGSRAFVVEEKDTAGGVGANFLVEWTADGPVVEPVIEAVMISTASTQGISFVTQGRPIERE